MLSRPSRTSHVFRDVPGRESMFDLAGLSRE